MIDMANKAVALILIEFRALISPSMDSSPIINLTSDAIIADSTPHRVKIIEINSPILTYL